MITYPTELKEQSAGISTGRVLIIDDFTKLTPHKFYDYVSEGFIPVFIQEEVEEADITYVPVFAMFSKGVMSDGRYVVTVFNAVYVSEGWDTPYVKND